MQRHLIFDVLKASRFTVVDVAASQGCGSLLHLNCCLNLHCCEIDDFSHDASELNFTLEWPPSPELSDNAELRSPKTLAGPSLQVNVEQTVL